MINLQLFIEDTCILIKIDYDLLTGLNVCYFLCRAAKIFQMYI